MDVQGSVSRSVHDPCFVSQSVVTPVRDPNLVACKSVVPPAPCRISMGNTPHPNTLTPQKAAELLRLHDAVLTKQACSPLTRNSVVARSPSPTNEDLFDDAIAGLADFDMDASDSDNNNEDNDDGHVRKAVKIQESRGRPKAADYEPSVRTIFGITWALYRGRLCTEGAMPDRMQEVTWAKLAWNEACKRLQSRVAYDAEIIKMITSRSSHFHGEVKSKVWPYITDEYGFETSTRQSVIDHNIMLVHELKKDFSFVYKTRSPDGNKGLYSTKIIQKVVNMMWFRDKKDEGVLYPEFYKPFPEVGLALLLTVIESRIDEWSTGSQTNKMFTVDEYQSVLNEHLNNLVDFDEHTKAQGLLPKLLSRLHDNGRIYSKADPLGHKIGRTMACSAFEAAIEEYNEGRGVSSDDEGDE
ncbi:hypothetical protein EDD22DRAFT_851560 [Suillus occidentalis]|nr:hypothetical protein EDD22DRAFT_851560 [Suillus occidentalis]